MTRGARPELRAAAAGQLPELNICSIARSVRASWSSSRSGAHVRRSSRRERVLAAPRSQPSILRSTNSRFSSMSVRAPAAGAPPRRRPLATCSPVRARPGRSATNAREGPVARTPRCARFARGQGVVLLGLVPGVGIFGDVAEYSIANRLVGSTSSSRTRASAPMAPAARTQRRATICEPTPGHRATDSWTNGARSAREDFAVAGRVPVERSAARLSRAARSLPRRRGRLARSPRHPRLQRATMFVFARRRVADACRPAPMRAVRVPGARGRRHAASPHLGSVRGPGPAGVSWAIGASALDGRARVDVTHGARRDR